MNLLKRIQKVEKSNFSKQKVEQLLEDELQAGLKYGTIVFIQFSMSLLGMRDEQLYGKGNLKTAKWMTFARQWQLKIADKYNIDVDYLNSFNGYIMDNFRKLVMEYDTDILPRAESLN